MLNRGDLPNHISKHPLLTKREMKDFKQTISQYSNKDLDQKRTWYSTVAEAYDKVRPRYPKELIERAIELAQLPKDAILLEIGCGPGTATVAFAQAGFSMLCLEPNPDFCQLARHNCTPYPTVEIWNTSFEEWELEEERFSAVLAATSIHWIPPEVAYPKAAEALRDNGSLILLWNMQLQPRYEMYQVLEEVYKIYAPSLAGFEQRETQEENLTSFGQIVMDSGRFKDLVSEQLVCEVTYSIDDYLALLSTYSPYIELGQENRDSLFEGLREKIEHNSGASIQLSYLCAFQVARKL